MTLVALIFTYFIVWWTVLFAILPWGNKQPNKYETGMAHGAPANPNIKKKFMATTVVSFVILAIIYTCIEMNLIDFREIARDMDARIYGDHSVAPH